ncbi:S53 family peptidase [Ktedonospora formicarum]|uniref:Pseudomonapepsin n=1 Tax=Ktedonospora formicarum TaxID=2778364 RepID=A0A8J3I0M2_9CHLR|nr:S53 family peptidase [Ktedonospora formicarum]GHO43369.1 pseudomonapepsin [Ktedonospora formicarum]
MKLSTRKWSFPLALIALLLLVAAIIAAQVLGSHLAASANGPNHGHELGQRTKLSGHMAPLLKKYKPMHASNGQQTLNLAISLNLRNSSELDALLAAQNNPHSPLYHHYLTSQEFAQRFSPTRQEVQRVTAYVRANGLRVTGISSNNQLINVSGTMENVERVFNVSISDYNLDGHIAYAPTNEPSVPADMANMILHISGLTNAARYQPQLTALPGNTRQRHQGPQGGYTPTELRTAYNVTPLLQAGNDGTGQTVALFELDGYTPSNIDTYLQQYDLGAPKYSNVLVDGATNTPGSGAVEVELDMEVVSAIAPGANQKVYIGPNSDTGVIDTYNKIVTDNAAKVVSISWGLCEQSSGDAMLDSLNNIFKQGASQGQAFFAASGDAGAYDCGDNQLAVDSPASDPNVVGVGGTRLQLSTNGTYQEESVWSDPTTTDRGPNGVGGGGGISSHFSRPTYQDGVQDNANRTVPDVSADADPQTGYSVFATGRWGTVGGTSAAAPLWAGIATLINQHLKEQNQPTLGNAHTQLYNLFTKQQTAAPFHDVTTGDNLHYQATQGYDLASGLGTPNAWNIAQDLAATNNGDGNGDGDTGTTT